MALCCLCAASRLVLLPEAEVVCINSTCFSTFMANANLTNITLKWYGRELARGSCKPTTSEMRRLQECSILGRII
jgi:hypothetical protein